MIPRFDSDWAPTPELLAAYFDGEFEGRDDLALLRQRLENWLTDHAAAQADLADYHRLRRLWQETTPPEPDRETWNRVLTGVAGEAKRTPAASRRSGPWKFAAAFAVAACLTLAVFLLLPRGERSAAEEDNFLVATEHEVEILHVEGADTGSLVVGQLPLLGPLELAGPGDVTLTSVQPASRDNMVPHVDVGGPGRPIIWARLETDDED